MSVRAEASVVAGGRLCSLTLTTIVICCIAAGRTGAAQTFDLTTASIADINAAFDAGSLTSERLTQLYLARIAAYDKKGPMLNAVFRINPTALEDARALDGERRAQ